MNIDDIELHHDELDPPRPYKELGKVTATISWSFAQHAFSGRPQIPDLYPKLKASAAARGGNAVIKCRFFDRGALIGEMKAEGIAILVEQPATKKCPFCAEEIKAEAIVCRFCSRDLPVSAS